MNFIKLNKFQTAHMSRRSSPAPDEKLNIREMLRDRPKTATLPFNKSRTSGNSQKIGEVTVEYRKIRNPRTPTKEGPTDGRNSKN